MRIVIPEEATQGVIDNPEIVEKRRRIIELIQRHLNPEDYI